MPCAWAQNKIKVLTIHENIINPVTADYIEKGLKLAQSQEAILILNIDTPGGLLKSTEKIVKLILNSPVPVIAYVYPKGARAASAGVFISYASNILAMSPSTHIGAAHPVIGGGSWGSIDEETKKKIMNDTLAWAENISQTRNRPFSFIKEAVQESVSITETQALKRKVCDLTAADIDDLIEKIDGMVVETTKGKIKLSTKDALVEEVHLSQREKLLDTIIDPNIAYMLLTLGFLGLIFEVTHPGFGFPGIAGVICLVLSFYAFSILPLNYAGLALIILGILFFIIEAFTPTFGMFTLGGVASFFFGSIMLFNQPQILRVSYATIFPIVFFFAFLSVFFLTRTLAILRRKPITGAYGLMNEVGIAKTNIAKTGKVFVHGETWNATSDEKIKKGQEIVVEEIKGLKLKVKKKEG